MYIYRGFSCLEEALNVLKYRTAGGVIAEINWSAVVDKVVENQKTTGGEGIVGIVDKGKDRGGFIEYTMNLDVAFNHGPLCVICCFIMDNEIDWERSFNNRNDSENGVFLPTNKSITITSFSYGFYYKQYRRKLSIKEELLALDKYMGEFRSRFFRIKDVDYLLLQVFLNQTYNILDNLKCLCRY
jgi:hypothetical protein